MGIRHISVGTVEVKHLLSELHANLVRVRASPAPKYFQSGWCINLSECMGCGCRRADPVVSQAYPGMPNYVLAFLHHRQPSSLLHLGKRGFGSMVKQWRGNVKAQREGNPNWHDYGLMVRVMVGGGH